MTSSDMSQEIRRTVDVLRRGGLILYPTDTVWGIGCDATDPEAVAAVYRLKQRASAQSMLILLPHEGMLTQYVRDVPDIAYQLIEVADKPLTLIYPGAKNLATNIIAEDGSIGIRIPHDDFCRQLLQAFRKPIVSTSANIHGEPPARIFSEISDPVRQGVDYIVQWRQGETVSDARPSSIIKLGYGGTVQIIRP